MSKYSRSLGHRYIEGSEGYAHLFVRAKGQAYYCERSKCMIRAQRSEVILQWGGLVDYDSGYHASVWSDTPTNRRKAWAKLQAF